MSRTKRDPKWLLRVCIGVFLLGSSAEIAIWAWPLRSAVPLAAATRETESLGASPVPNEYRTSHAQWSPKPPPAAASTPEPATTPVVATAEGGPFAFLEPERSQRKALYEAEELAVAACMRQKGFEYTPNIFVEERAPADELPRYRPGDIDVAKEIGYGLVEAFEVGELPAPADVNEVDVAAMSPEQQHARDEALFGPRPLVSPAIKKTGRLEIDDPNWAQIESGGGQVKFWYRDSCFARARREVQGDEVSYARQEGSVLALLQEAHDAAERAPEVQAALVSWRECMARSGHQYESPQAAADALQRELRTGNVTLDELRQREIDVATQDAHCDLAVRLSELYAAAQAAEERNVAQGNVAELQGFRDLQAAAIRRAKGMLANGER